MLNCDSLTTEQVTALFDLQGSVDEHVKDLVLLAASLVVDHSPSMTTPETLGLQNHQVLAFVVEHAVTALTRRALASYLPSVMPVSRAGHVADLAGEIKQLFGELVERHTLWADNLPEATP